MRNAFIDELTLLAEKNEKIFLIVGDLGFGVIENFEQRFPKQFLNAGVAEQNMMGMAAGLASAGYQVFVYSIANFPVFRCLEQIRNDICYQELNVSIVSIGAGLSYGTLGYSHHAIDDIGVMRALPGMTIYSPADPIETRLALNSSIAIKTPKYFRLGKSGEPSLFNTTASSFPNWTNLVEGNQLLLLTTGTITIEAIAAAEILNADGIEISVYSIPVLKPFLIDVSLFEKYQNILVVEEHSILGGLGSIVSEQISQNGLQKNLSLLGLPDLVHHELGSQKYLRNHFKIDSLGIVKRVRKMLGV
jgi:transketolase